MLHAAQPAIQADTQPTLPSLGKGFNLAHWFEYERNQALTAEELRGLQQAGLDHVRLPLDPMACGWSPDRADQLVFLNELEQAVRMASDAGLTAIVDLHLRPDHKEAMQGNAQYEASVVTLWDRLARHFGAWPVASVAFELFNEPQFYGVQGLRWPGFQRRLLAAVRAHSHRHLVLLSGPKGGSLEALLALKPEPDTRAAYTFHFYDPFVFTHQALPWLDDRYTAAGARADVLYPARLHQGRPPRKLREHALAAREWSEFMAADWGAAAVRRQMDSAGAWARKQGVRVLCTEFGAIRAGVDPASRYRWLSDVRQALEANQLGWSVWEYTHIFGLTEQSTLTGQAGRRSLDAAAYAALGLRRPRA